MDEKSIGVILSKRQWKQLFENGTNIREDSIYYQYAKRGEELNLEVIFLNIDDLNLNTMRGDAFVLQDNLLIERSSVPIPSIVYNPTSYNRKKNVKTIHALANQGITVINERNNMKKKHLHELFASKSELKNFIRREEFEFKPPIIFTVLGQKNFPNQWNIPLLYAKNAHDEIWSFGEALQYLTNDDVEREEIPIIIYETSKKIFEIIHYYYPGWYEVGLQFIVDKGQVYFQSTASIMKILKDISILDKNIVHKIVQWPIGLANQIKLNKCMGSEEHSISIENQFQEDIFTLNRGTLNRNVINFWVKFKVFEDPEMTLKLPSRMAELMRKPPDQVKFGVLEAACSSIIFEDSISLRNNSYHFPINLFISDSLAEKLHIPLDLVFQIHFSNGRATIGPTIGLLLGEKNQSYHLEYMEKYSDRFGDYERFGGVTIAFSTRSVDWHKKIVHGMIYDPAQKQWRYGSAPIPAAIYRRNFHQNPKHIKQLVKLTGNNLFNSYHFKKSDLYLLKDKAEIKKHLPLTFLLRDTDELIEFLLEQKKIILKPVSLSRGRGIFILEVSNDDGFHFYDYRNNTKVQYWLEDELELLDLLDEFGILEQDYLYQTYIPLLKVNNRAFDVRIVMQKYNKMKWYCSGIECRVAQENEDLTNIARGGEAMTLEDVIRMNDKDLAFSFVHRRILNLCHEFCHLMDKGDEHFAEFGLDIALDEAGYPWILEANIFPSFKGFKAMDYDTYLRIRYQPLFYSVQIQGFSILDEGAVRKTFNFRERMFN